MKKAIVIIALLFATIAHAGPECRTYGLDYDSDHYAIRFACETSGIGAAYTIVNGFEYPAYLYLFTGDRVVVLKLGEFNYADGELRHESGIVFELEPN